MPILCGLALLTLASQDTAKLRALLDIEDSRPHSLTALAPLVHAARSNDTLLARWAIRGLGRQQRADLIPILGDILSKTGAALQPEALNAVAQSGVRDGAPHSRATLEEWLDRAGTPEARGVTLRSLGRLPVASPEEADRTERQLAGDGSRDAAIGLASFYRRTAARRPPSREALDRLGAMVRMGPSEIARPAISALVATGRSDTAHLLEALQHPDREVRRAAALATFVQADLPGRERVIDAAWKDRDAAVRYEAVRAFGRHLAGRETCEPLLAALDDPDGHVSLLAIDLLGGCGAGVIPRLSAIAREPVLEDRWHRPAHALVAAARIDASAAGFLLPAFTSSRVWWARMYAARAADTARVIPTLTALARDPHPNVREAAIAGLRRHVGHEADSLYLAALEAGDYQLIQTAATALDSSPDPRAIPALWQAFVRLTSEKRETSRDPRMAILSSIEHIGSQPLASELRETASDFDSTVAAAAARLASRWSATSITPTPQALPRQQVPSWTDLQRWSRMTVEITMRNGGVIRMKLRPFDAPTNVRRFVSMVNRGWFDGLTWHRVVPNFVVQGGSPGANEYMGDGPFTRDELTFRSHVRGTVGISTRGRDTGDGQLFINLIDNWRLDHEYTIIGEIVAGMDVVDAMQEGATIQRVTLIPDKS